MTSEQKETIRGLRTNGLCYRAIAEITRIGYQTIKSFCRRNGLIGADKGNIKKVKYAVCKNCGKKLWQEPKRKKRLFCCDDCRVKWWSKNPQMINRKAIYDFICLNYGNAFSAYGNSKRKYCCHECYIEHRFGKNGDNSLKKE